MLVTRRRLIGSGLALSLIDFSALAEPATEADGFFILKAAPAALRLLPEPAAPTEVFAYNGSVPGPLLRIKKGEELKIRLVNGLARPTSLACLGLRGPNASDGVAPLTQKPVAPGESFELRLTPPDSGLFSYRPGFAPFAAEQLGRGLFGALIVDEAEPPKVARDLVAILADWRLDADGRIEDGFVAKEEALGQGRIGALVAVNAEPAPFIVTAAPGARIRLRLVSAFAARIATATFDSVAPTILAIDGQPANAPFEPLRRSIPIGPGARFDLLLDLPAKAGEEAKIVLRQEKEQDLALIVLRAEGEALAPAGAVAPLAPNPLLPAQIRLETAARAELVIEPAKQTGTGPQGQPLVWSVNGVAAAPFAAKPLFTVKRGAPVSLALVNRSAVTQQIHLRGHHVRLLHDLDDGWEPYWRDCVLVAPGRTKRVAFVAGEPGKWAILSLIPDRAAAGLAAWFLVT